MLGHLSFLLWNLAHSRCSETVGERKGADEGAQGCSVPTSTGHTAVSSSGLGRQPPGVMCGGVWTRSPPGVMRGGVWTWSLGLGRQPTRDMHVDSVPREGRPGHSPIICWDWSPTCVWGAAEVVLPVNGLDRALVCSGMGGERAWAKVPSVCVSNGSFWGLSEGSPVLGRPFGKSLLSHSHF